MLVPAIGPSYERATCVGGVSKTSRSAQAVPDPAQGAGATVPVPALMGSKGAGASPAAKLHIACAAERKYLRSSRPD